QRVKRNVRTRWRGFWRRHGARSFKPKVRCQSGKSFMTEFDIARPCRREVLRIGGAGLFALAGARLLAESRSARSPRAHSVIFLHQWGGPAQHESFDMKPNAPEQVRNIFKPISTNVTGVQVCELLPAMASVMDKVCLVRTLQHTMKNHN